MPGMAPGQMPPGGPPVGSMPQQVVQPGQPGAHMMPPGAMRDAQLAGALVALQPGMTHDPNGVPVMHPGMHPGYMVGPDGTVMQQAPQQ